MYLYLRSAKYDMVMHLLSARNVKNLHFLSANQLECSYDRMFCMSQYAGKGQLNSVGNSGNDTKKQKYINLKNRVTIL